MQIVHIQKFVRTSPRKLREVADVVRGLEPQYAIDILPHTGKRAALYLEKAIKAAFGNAKNRNVTGNLVIKELHITDGPRLKRGRAASRGRWLPYKRRMSHIKVILETVEIDTKKAESHKVSVKKVKSEKQNTKLKTNKNVQSSKKIEKTKDKKVSIKNKKEGKK